MPTSLISLSHLPNMRSIIQSLPGTIRMRRSTRSLPATRPRSTLPTSFTRPITIQAKPQSPNDDSSPNFEIVDDTPSPSNYASSSQHPFSNITPDPEPSSSSTANIPARASTLPQPPQLSEAKWTRVQHPFDTHAFVSYLEKAGLSTGSSTALMEAVRKMIVRRSDRTRESMMAKEDMENAAYLFRAALSELRTELSVKARNDGENLRSMAATVRREVDSLDQKIKEDIQTLKHDIEMDMNNRNAENRSELKEFDLSIEEINNKFTISLGDLRTEIESAKWDATRRAISIIVMIVIVGVGATLFTTDSTPPVTPPIVSVSPPAIMRDMSVGTDEDTFDPDAALSEDKLEKILRESGLQVGRERPKKKEKVKDNGLHVDRI